MTLCCKRCLECLQLWGWVLETGHIGYWLSSPTRVRDDFISCPARAYVDSWLLGYCAVWALLLPYVDLYTEVRLHSKNYFANICFKCVSSLWLINALLCSSGVILVFEQLHSLPFISNVLQQETNWMWMHRDQGKNGGSRERKARWMNASLRRSSSVLFTNRVFLPRRVSMYVLQTL